jgi:hypothetical protein
MRKEVWNIATKPRSVVALRRAEISDSEEVVGISRTEARFVALDMEHSFVPFLETRFDGCNDYWLGIICTHEI